MGSERLIVFAKAPVEGEVKTRLIPELGARGALRAHIQMVEDVLIKAKTSGIESTLWLSERNDLGKRWGSRYSIPVRVQQGDDLGSRMLDAISRTLTNQHGKVVLIGSDCPSLEIEDILSAFLSLEENDIVLCPSEDGGYGLVGMNQAHPEIFSGITWSSPMVTKQTLSKIEGAALSVGLGRTIWDVDNFEDWQRYQRWRELR